VRRIQENEWELYKNRQSTPTPESSPRQVHGVNWDVFNDQLFFDISNVAQQMKRTRPTKRNAVSLATRFYDPLGIISPITVRFKQLFQKLCERKLDWDENLMGELLTEWLLISNKRRTAPLLPLKFYLQIRAPACESFPSFMVPPACIILL
jgi:hypothetical protein